MFPSKNVENSPSTTKTDTRFEMEPLNINYSQPLLAASLIKCFSCVLPLGNPPHQRNGEWERLNDSESFGCFLQKSTLGKKAKC